MQLKGDKVSLTEHNLLGLFGGTAQVELLQPHCAEYKPRYLQQHSHCYVRGRVRGSGIKLSLRDPLLLLPVVVILSCNVPNFK